MFKGLITVGTSSFCSLISAVDNIKIKNIEFEIQTGSTEVKPKNYQHFDYIDEFENYLKKFDFIITHSGAGSVYHCLEKGYKIIVVPNKERLDLHQLELARYVKENNLGLVCFELNEIESAVNKIIENKITFNKYEKVDFFRHNEILEFLNND